MALMYIFASLKFGFDVCRANSNWTINKHLPCMQRCIRASECSKCRRLQPVILPNNAHQPPSSAIVHTQETVSPGTLHPNYCPFRQHDRKDNAQSLKRNSLPRKKVILPSERLIHRSQFDQLQVSPLTKL